MKKYKLIKTYPNSPKVGTIINNKRKYWSYDKPDTTGIMVLLNGDHPKKYPEFWEEVAEKEYEILSIKLDDKIYYLDNIQSGIYCNGNTGGCIAISHYDNYTINSVKRLSDGEIFTIGDNTPCGKIKSFELIENTIKYITESGSGSGLMVMRKSKQPLFKTYDGVDIFEGDEYTLVRKGDITKHLIVSTTYIAIKNNGKWSKLDRYDKLFSTREKAKLYISLKEVKYSASDIYDTICKGFDRSNATALGKHRILAMFSEFNHLQAPHKPSTYIDDNVIAEISTKLDNYFQTWNSSTMIDRQVLMELLKQK